MTMKRTHTHADVKTHTDVYTQTISPFLLRYKGKRSQRDLTLKTSSVHQIPMKRGSAGLRHRNTPGSPFHLGNESGKRNAEELE